MFKSVMDDQKYFKGQSRVPKRQIKKTPLTARHQMLDFILTEGDKVTSYRAIRYSWLGDIKMYFPNQKFEKAEPIIPEDHGRRRKDSSESIPKRFSQPRLENS